MKHAYLYKLLLCLVVVGVAGSCSMVDTGGTTTEDPNGTTNGDGGIDNNDPPIGANPNGDTTDGDVAGPPTVGNSIGDQFSRRHYSDPKS